jgi:hypothetical protein
MATGYTRNDTTNNIANGNIINAADLDGEFDAIQAAYDVTTGHDHDGTVGGGAPIRTLGPAQDVVITTSVVRPKTDNTVDLGTSTLEFKDLYLDGTAKVDTLTVDENASVTGTLNVTGTTTLGTVNVTTLDTTNLEVTNLKAKDGTSAGSIADSTGVVTLASSVLTTADINGGTIDGVTIATSDITVGSGKTLNVSAGTLTLADNQISGDKVEGGTINAITITTLGSTTGNITTVNSTTVDTTNLEVTNLKAKDGTSAGSIANSTGVVTLASSVLTTTDINGGTVDGAVIGGASAAAGTFTTATATTGNITTVNATTVDTTNIEVTNIKAKDGTASATVADTTGVMTVASLVATTADINGGTVDNATIATSDITVGAGKTLNVSAGTLTLADNQISGDKVEGGTINAITINTLGSTTGNITTVNATTVDTTNIEVTTIKAKDGTSAGSIADSTGVVTLASSVLTTTDINGGTVDGTVIGGSSAAAITGTTITATGDVTIADKIVHAGDTNTSIRFPAADTVTVETSGAERLRIDSSGNVGIATTTPASALNVVGDQIILSGGAGTSQLGLQIKSVIDAIPAAQTQGYIATGNSPIGVAGDLLIAPRTNSTASVRFITGTTPTERMRVDASGNVYFGNGVNVASPANTGLFATNGSGTDIAGASMTIQGGRGTGAGAGGSLIFNTAAAGTTGTSLNAATERMRITSAGNVGIGTSSPSVKLDVTGEISSTGRHLTAQGVATSGYQFVGDGDSGMYQQASNQLQFSTANVERMRIDSSGNVGIGTASPAQRLHVKGVSGSPAIQVETSNGTNNSTQPVLTVGTDTLTYQAQIALVREGTSGLLGWSFLTNAVSSPIERMRITSAGSVLVGATSGQGVGSTLTPALLVEVAGSGGYAAGFVTDRADAFGTVLGLGKSRGTTAGSATVVQSGDTLGSIRFAGADGTDLQSIAAQIDGQVDGTPGANDMPGRLVFSTTADGSASPTERMRITSAGNVGIGTTTPGAMLDLAADNTAGTALNVLRFTDTDLSATSPQELGKIEFYSSDSSAPGAGVKASIVGVAEVGNPGAALTFNTDAQTGAPIERLRIDRFGFVGIGTSVPADYNSSGRNLVVGTTSGNNGITIASGSTAQGSLFFADGTANAAEEAAGYLTYVHSDDSMRIGTGNTERMRIDSSGNVGIGTNAPASLLNLQAATPTLTMRSTTTTGTTLGNKGNRLLLQANSSTPGNGGELVWAATDTDTGRWAAISGNIVTNNSGSATGSLVFATKADAADTALTERMRINPTGAVYIGNGEFSAAPANGFLRATNASGTDIAGAAMLIWGGRSTGSAAGGPITFSTSPAGTTGTSTNAATERMRIDSSGNVGIGTTSPTVPLNVVSASADIATIYRTGVAGEARLNFSNANNSSVSTVAARLGGQLTATTAGAEQGVMLLSTMTSGTVTEKMRIDASGNVLVGTTTTIRTNDDGITLSETGLVDVSLTSGISGRFTRRSTDGDTVQFRRDTTVVGSISVTTTATAYNTSSDYRLKESIQPIFGASDRVRQLNPVNFAWKADGTRTDGFIAHEVQAVAPQAVTGEKDGEEMQAIDHSKLVPLLTAALQEALTEIALLKARLDTANI